MTSYINPDQTVRLLRRLRTDSPKARLIVSHDRKNAPPPTAALQKLGAELWLTPQEITWGDASYLHSQLAAIERAALADEDWITILTGQDYPLRPLTEYEAHLRNLDADMVLEEPDDNPALPALLHRYETRAYRIPRWAGRHRARQVIGRLPGLSVSSEPHGLPPYLLRSRLRTPFSPRFRLYKGCDLYALSGKAARALLTAPPELLRYYEHTRVPSESYPHTVLRNNPSLSNRAGMIHYARWRGSPHPDWLTTADLPEMLASGFWFARKFQQDDPVLDALDEHLDAASRQPM